MSFRYPAAINKPGYNSLLISDAPIIGAALAISSTAATVAFTDAVNKGGSGISSYTATSSPGGITATGIVSPITVSGLTTNTAYTFTVTATNIYGTSAPSAASNSVTPVAYELWSWGNNAGGRLGLNNITKYSSPKQVGTLTDWWSNIFAAYTSSFAVKADNTLWAWGDNNWGQLGINDIANRSSPTQVGALTNWKKASAPNTTGQAHTAATKTNGTLWMWGYNVQGQLGNNTVYNVSSPAQVGALTTWLNVACGHYFTVATKTDGTLWSWGKNNSGQLGLGNITDYSSPVQVGALATWSNVIATRAATIATKTDGTLWSWGDGASGPLGLNNTTVYSSPKQVGLLTNWLSIAGGQDHVVALKTDGTFWSWGRNNNGQLGFGNISNYSSPTQIGALTTWLNISAGGYISAAIKANTLWVWGSNSDGQLGLGNPTNYSSPKQVGALSTWSTVSCGYQSMLATKTP